MVNFGPQKLGLGGPQAPGSTPVLMSFMFGIYVSTVLLYLKMLYDVISRCIVMSYHVM